jgi:hypothetical protein
VDKDQQAQDCTWTTAAAGGTGQPMDITGTIANKSSTHEGLLDRLLSSVDEEVLDDSKVIKERMECLTTEAQARGRGEELDVDCAMGLQFFFELDLSWNQYHALNSAWRHETETWTSDCRSSGD